MKLSDMTTGKKGIVVGFFNCEQKYRRKLLRMGILKGVEFTFVRKAPLGDPIEIKICGCSVSLRKEEAEVLNVKEI
ncbi:MAG: ferrous iron transport protein A [Caldisericia bacterium]|nr:ferrous iron transport protein A [Caldisericia bacterium]